MSNILDFGVWAPTEQVFWDSWITAGICTAPRVFAPGYSGIMISDQTSQGWTPMKNGEPVPGWHANVRVFGAQLIAEFTYGLAQTDAHGNLLPLFDRTWAKEVFQLTEQPFDPVAGFPAGYRNSQGVTYADVRDFSSPSNVWA